MATSPSGVSAFNRPLELACSMRVYETWPYWAFPPVIMGFLLRTDVLIPIVVMIRAGDDAESDTAASVRGFSGVRGYWKL